MKFDPDKSLARNFLAIENTLNALSDRLDKQEEAIRCLADINGEAKAQGYKSAKLNKVNKILTLEK